jgi:hypothetical protein
MKNEEQKKKDAGNVIIQGKFNESLLEMAVYQ